MAKQKFDVKKFLLEKGERVGIGMAAGVMVLMLAVGAMAGLNRDSPTKTASDITENANTIESKLRSGPALSPPGLDPSVLVTVDGTYISPSENRFVNDLSIDPSVEDKKRTKPTVLPPSEFQVAEFRGATRDLIIYPSGNVLKIGWLKPKATVAPKVDPRPADPRFANPYNQGRPGGFYQYKIYEELAKMAGEAGATEKFTLETVDIAKLPAGAKLAEAVHPTRMVVFYASFPYKAQLANYTRALKLDVNALIAAKELPAFEPCRMRRRAVDANGDPLKGKEGEWTEVDLEGNYDVIYRRMKDSEPEDAKLKPVLFEGKPILFPLPRLARGEYPRPALKTIDDTVEFLSKKGGAGLKLLHPLEARAKNGGIYRPVSEQPAAPTTEAKPTDTFEVPEYCLVRLADADPKLKPGMTYQYQVKTRLHNPNAGKKPPEIAFEDLGKDETLECADWAPADTKDALKKTTVTLGRELHLYAADVPHPELLKIKTNLSSRSLNDVAWLQAHQWQETVALASGSQTPLGDYVIADIPVRRGEFVSGQEPAPVPIWYPTREAWDFAVPVRGAKVQKIPLTPGDKLDGYVSAVSVYFGAKDPKMMDLVVDYEGGVQLAAVGKPGQTLRNVNDNAGFEVLLMAPDGSLRAHNSKVDARDRDRDKRVADWKKSIQDIRSGGKPAGGIEFKK